MMAHGPSSLWMNWHGSGIIKFACRVGIASGNCRMLPFIQARNCVIEGRAKIGVGRAAVSNPPTGVHRKAGEVGEPSDLPGPVCGAARQSAKAIKVDGRRALRSQVRVKEGGMADLIIGIVVDILVHVAIKNLKGSGVEWIPAIYS